MYAALKRQESQCKSEKVNGRNHFKDLGTDGGILLKLVLGKEIGGRAWPAFIWHRKESSDGLVYT
jgi:hypothetical protein